MRNQIGKKKTRKVWKNRKRNAWVKPRLAIVSSTIKTKAGLWYSCTTY